jgi:hypothetical protein
MKNLSKYINESLKGSTGAGFVQASKEDVKKYIDVWKGKNVTPSPDDNVDYIIDALWEAGAELDFVGLPSVSDNATSCKLPDEKSMQNVVDWLIKQNDDTLAYGFVDLFIKRMIGNFLITVSDVETISKQGIEETKSLFLFKNERTSLFDKFIPQTESKKRFIQFSEYWHIAYLLAYAAFRYGIYKSSYEAIIDKLSKLPSYDSLFNLVKKYPSIKEII